MPANTIRNFFLTAMLLVSIAGCSQTFDPGKLNSSVLFKGDEATAYRDPMVCFHEGIFYCYFTIAEIEKNGEIYLYTALSKTRDLKNWSDITKITARDQSLNYSSPGNIIRYKNEWIMCLQTYPRPGYTIAQMPKYGDASARLFIMRSKDLEQWSEPELLYVKGDTVAEQDMGRMIDPFILEDQNEKGKWWIFYKQNGASRAYSYDLAHWTYEGHIPAGENICIIPKNGEYTMFHSPENGIGIKKSNDLAHWTGETKVLTLGQAEWPWAKGRITAGFVLELKDAAVKNGYRYLLFFHGSGPLKETEGDFDKNASIGVAWSKDMEHWEWK